MTHKWRIVLGRPRVEAPTSDSQESSSSAAVIARPREHYQRSPRHFTESFSYSEEARDHMIYSGF
jgi:hypothetical protein